MDMDMNMNVADLRPLQIPLVQSVTEDEEDDSPTKNGEHEYEGVDKHVSSESYHHPHDNMNQHQHQQHYSADPHAALVDQVRSNNSNSNSNNNREALAYLLRYETMVRQQEAEDMATIDHMRPCVERLRQLAGMNSMNINMNSMNMNINMNSTAHTEDVLTQEISYGQLKTALERLEQSQLEQQSQKVDARDRAANGEFMTTDRQLMMVLRLLTKSVPSTTITSDTDTDSASSSTSSEEDQDNTSTMTITWAEFLQCYKTCIVGMLTLQHLPKSANPQLRARTRDRTLSMLSLFQPPTTTFATSSNDNLSLLQQHAQAFDVRRPGVDSLASVPSSSPSSSSTFFKNSKKKVRRAIIAVAALIGIIVIMAPASIPYSGSTHISSTFEVDPIVVTNNGVEIASTVVSAESILQASSSSSMLALQQKQQSLPSIFFSRTPLVVEKRNAVPVRQAVTSPTTALPLTPPQEFMPLSTPHHPTTESMVSVAPAMIGGVVGCLGAPLLVAGLQSIFKQAAVTATAMGGSVSTASIGSTGLLVPVLAGMGALMAVTSVARGIWTVLRSLVRH